MVDTVGSEVLNVALALLKVAVVAFQPKPPVCVPVNTAGSIVILVPSLILDDADDNEPTPVPLKSVVQVPAFGVPLVSEAEPLALSVQVEFVAVRLPVEKL